MAKDPESPPVAPAPATARLVRYRAKSRGFWQGHLVEVGREFMGPPDAKATWFEPAATARRAPAQMPKPITSEGLTGQQQPNPQAPGTGSQQGGQQPPPNGGQGQTGQ
jgi:hypothetical protein